METTQRKSQSHAYTSQSHIINPQASFPYIFYLFILTVLQCPIISASTASPTYSPIAPTTLQTGTRVLVTDSSPRTTLSQLFTVTYSQSILNPKLVLSFNKLSCIPTSSAGITSYKYYIETPVTTSTALTGRLKILTGNTMLYETIIQYMVYNSQDALVQTLQLSSMNSALSTTNFYFGFNYHQQTVNIDRTINRPSNHRYYLPQSPTCNVFILGYKVEYMTSSIGISVNCSIQYGTNAVLITVSGNDDIIIDTLYYSLMVFVGPQGRYFGYFQDPLGHAYQTTGSNNINVNTNSSRQYILININNYNRLSTSPYASNINQCIPQILSTGTNSYTKLYGITQIAVQEFTQLYRHSTDLEVGTVTYDNAAYSIQSTYAAWITSYNAGHMLVISLVQCSNGYYYDRVSAVCYQYWSGSAVACNGLQYLGNIFGYDLTAQANNQLDVIVGLFGHIIDDVTNSYEITMVHGHAYNSSVDWFIWHIDSNQSNEWVESTNMTVESANQDVIGIGKDMIIRGYQMYRIGLNYSNNSNSSFNQIRLMGSLVNEDNDNLAWQDSVLSADSMQLVDMQSKIRDMYLNLEMKYQNITYNASGQLSQLRVLATINNRLQTNHYIVVSIGQQSQVLNIDTYFNSSHEILQQIRMSSVDSYTYNNTYVGNITTEDIILTLQQQARQASKRISLQIIKAEVSTQDSTSSTTFRVEQTYKVVIDNFVFVYAAQFRLTCHYSPTNSTNSTNIRYVVNNDSNIKQVHIDSAHISLVYSQQLTIPGLSAQNYILHVQVNHINHTSIPQFINLSQYSFLQAHYNSKYYQSKQMYISYVLKNGNLAVYGAVMANLQTYFNNVPINSTVNYTYVYDVWMDALVNDNGSIGVSSAYDSYYNNPANRNLYIYHQLSVQSVVESQKSSIMSQLGNEGNPSPLHVHNYTGQNVQAAQVLLLMNNGDGPVDVKITKHNIFVLTNVNLLYIYQKQQLQNSTNISNLNSNIDLSVYQAQKLVRMLDLYRYMSVQIQATGTIKQVSTSIEVDQLNGILYVATNKGRLYTIQCQWGTRQDNVYTPGLVNREYAYRFVQLDIPVPPPNNTNNTNNTNSTNNTNGSSVINDTNNTINTNNTEQQSDNYVSSTGQQQQTFPVSAIIIVSIVGSIFGISFLVAIYWLLIKPSGKNVKVNPQLARTRMYNTKSFMHDSTQMAEKTQTKIERVASGKTQATLIQFDNGGQSSVNELQIRKPKVKKTKGSKKQLKNMQVLDNRQSGSGTRVTPYSPYADDNDRGLIGKNRVFIIQDIQL